MEKLPLAVLLLMVFAGLRSSAAKTVPGYLSLDCGSDISTSYDDEETGLTWTSDRTYTSAGKEGKSVLYSHNHYTTYQRTFRYFPEQRHKYCYELPFIPSDTTFLVRAGFTADRNSSYLDLSSENSTQFDLAINATRWYTVHPTINRSPIISVAAAEGMFLSPGGIVNFCLIPKSGTPFISSLEIRHLEAGSKIYSFNENPEVCLIHQWRTGFVDNHSDSTRYPVDPYDRIWGQNQCDFGSYDDGVHYIVSNRSLKTKPSSANLNRVPSTVMSNAVVWENETGGHVVPHFYGGDFSGPQFSYLIFYFQELTDKSSGTTDMAVSTLGQKKLAVNISAEDMVQCAFTNLPVGTSADRTVQLRSQENAKDRTFLNAAEWYQELLFDFSQTVHGDAAAINLFREAYNLSHWDGDPCFPVPFDELECFDFGYIKSLKLLNQAKPVLMNTSYATGLTIHNDVFYLLDELSLVRCHVDDNFFGVILNFPVHVHNATLDLSYNELTKLPTFPDVFRPSLLNFSNNFIDNIAALGIDTTPFSFLTELDLSHNRIKFIPSSWGSDIFWSHLTYIILTKVDLSQNLISEDISSLRGLLGKYKSSMIELHLSNNNFAGVLDSDLYFSTLQSLRLANFDENHLGGVLDLTPWIISWQQQSKNSSYMGAIFSFINNSIVDIHPSTKDLDPNISHFLDHFLYFNQSGILLGGNPYCKRDKYAHLFTHKYLCRYSFDEPIKDSRKKNLLPILLPSLLGGGLLMVVLSAFALVVLRLIRRIAELKRDRDEIARRKIQPPFFTLADIKMATRNFHNENKIGQGGFGIVYKGRLRDGTTIAVKKLKLKPSTAAGKAAITDEDLFQDFLNEVVPITGIKHRNLIELKGCCIEDQQRILVYDFAENGNLEQALHGPDRDGSHPPLNLKTRIDICLGVARGLSYLHDGLQARIVHRDIKPANILLDQNFNAKIADFGLARFALEGKDFQVTRKAGTWGYLAPEYELSDKLDVFSFGVLVLEIMSGRRSIDDNLPPDARELRALAGKLLERNALLDLVPDCLREDGQHDQITSLLKEAVKCTNLHAEQRPSMFDVLSTMTRIFAEKTNSTGGQDQELLNSNLLSDPRRGLRRGQLSLAILAESEELEETESLLLSSVRSQDADEKIPSSSIVQALEIEEIEGSSSLSSRFLRRGKQ